MEKEEEHILEKFVDWFNYALAGERHYFHKTSKNIQALSLLEDDLIRHENRSCSCDLRPCGYGFCYVMQFMYGAVGADEVLKMQD